MPTTALPYPARSCSTPARSARLLPLFPTLLTACLLAAGISTAHASQTAPRGKLADVKLVDRTTGQPLRLYQHQGEYWVAGRPGASYAIDITNRTGSRILAVISVDGVNALDGKTASSAPDDGYVFNPRQNWAITGWRKSQSQVAAFYFSESDASYASRTGRPLDVGVIGVALFRERVPEPVRPPPVARRSPVADEHAPARMNESEKSTADAAATAPMPTPPSAPQASPATVPPPSSPSASAAESAAEAPAAPSAAEKAAKRAPSATANATPRSPSLGTGHGALETSHTRTVEFDSATQRPEQIVRIRYDSYANLVAKGIIREPRPLPERQPDAFPADAERSYVPDPPRY